MALTSAAVARLLNDAGGALLDSGDDQALFDVLTDYFTDKTSTGENEGMINVT